jgi:adenylate cyclase
MVKGRRGKIPIYELMGAFGAGAELEPDDATVRLCRLTRLAHAALVQEDFALALDRYHEILVEFPHDTVARELIRRVMDMDMPHPMPLQAAD